MPQTIIKPAIDKSIKNYTGAKVNKNTFETVLYCIFCILSGGLIYMIRVIITIAIREAFREK